MSDVLLPIQPGNLPTNYCFTSWQKLIVDFAAALFAKLSGQAFYSVGATKPDVQFNAYPWLNTTDGRWYTFSGQWISPHPWQQAASAGLRLDWEGTEGNLALFDGGDAGAASDRSGPMWEIDHNYDGRSSMGPGAISGSSPAKTLAESEAYGEGSHMLLVAELPASIPLAAILPGNRTNLETGAPQWLAPTGSSGTLATTPNTESASFPFTNSGGDVGHQTVHPVRGCYKIRRSSRIFYAVP